MFSIRKPRSILLVPLGATLVSLVVLTAAVSVHVATALTSSGGEYSAVIRRTEFGIPHIQAANFGGLGFGYGYAFAQDNICSLEQEVLTGEGSRSLHFGPTANAGDSLNPSVSNLDSDVYYRSLNESGVVQRLVRQSAPLGPSTDVKRLVAGYVAGVNRYLKVTGVAAISDPICRSQPWVRTITDIDIYRLMYNFTQTAGIEALKPLIANAKPAGVAASESTVKAVAKALPKAQESQFGSNAIAVGGVGSSNGHGLLLANPHFPWQGSKRFYQVQLTIPGKINVSGASLYGTPMVEIGHSKYLAWSHTVSKAQRFTMHQLQLAPGDPTSYLVDGKVEAMTKRTITVPVRAIDAAEGVVTRTLYSSRYGPLLANNWTDSMALAVRRASATNMRAADEWLAMGMADSVPALRAVQDRLQGIPFVNTVAADSAGRSYIADASVVPNVTDEMAKTCISTPIGKALYPAQTVLDGSTSKCDLGTDPDAIEPGMFGPSKIPSLERLDFVTNSNDALWLANPAQPVTGYPRIFGESVAPASLRTRMGLDIINGRISGTDGQGGYGFTEATLSEAIFANRNYSSEQTWDAVVTLCQESPVLTATNKESVDVSEACKVLANWDLHADPDSRGAVLWREFWLRALKATDLWSVPFDPAKPDTTPNTLNTASDSVRRALADTIQRMQAVGVPLDAPLSAAQLTSIGGEPLGVPGCTGEEGCYNVVTGAGRTGPLGDDGKFPAVAFGSSFIMSVDLGPDGPTGHTLLTYSQSANPASPHHGDQTRLFAENTLVKDRYTKEEIMSDPTVKVTVVHN